MEKINKQQEKFWKWAAVLAVIFCLALSFVVREGDDEDGKEARNIHGIEIAGQTLNVELADTPEARVQGLSYRLELKKGDSMLFVFNAPGIYPFWMKDMNFPIDIIWIDEQRRVVHVKENADPASYPEVFVSSEKALYVLETTAGFSKENNLKIGDKVKFDF